MRYFVHLSIPGEPVALARARMGKNGRWYTPQASRDAEQQIGLAWKASQTKPIPAGVPLKLSVWVTCQRPRNPAHPYPSRGDLDNYVKLASDALQKAGAFANDSQVVEIEAYKSWTDEGDDDGDDSPGIGIELMEVALDE